MVLFLTVLPITGALVADAIASTFGCTLSEAGSGPCVVGGTDIGESLGFWGVAPWFMFVTIPAGALALAVVGVSGAILTSRALRADGADPREDDRLHANTPD